MDQKFSFSGVLPESTRRRRITTAHLAALPRRSKPYEVSDPAIPGLQLHVSASGAKVWQLRFLWHDKRSRLTLGAFPALSQSVARDRARDARKLIDLGIDPRRAGLRRNRAQVLPKDCPFEHGTVAWLAAEFMERFIRPHRKHPEDVQRVLEVEILSRWSTRDVRTIKPRDVLELLDGIVERGSPIMANRVASTLTQMFKFALHRSVIDASPVQLLYRPGGPERARERVLGDNEVGPLLRNLDSVLKRAPHTAAMVRICLFTACRRGELAGARWEDLDLEGDGPTWRIPPENSKTGAECINALVPQAVKVFKRLKVKAGRSPWVLPAESGDGPIEPKLLTRSIARHQRAFARLGLTGFTIHDLRRTVRTGLARLRVPPHIAEAVLNHRAPGIVAVYDRHSYIDEKRDALTKWAAHLGKIEAPSDAVG